MSGIFPYSFYHISCFVVALSVLLCCPFFFILTSIFLMRHNIEVSFFTTIFPLNLTALPPGPLSQISRSGRERGSKKISYYIYLFILNLYESDLFLDSESFLSSCANIFICNAYYFFISPSPILSVFKFLGEGARGQCR